MQHARRRVSLVTFTTAALTLALLVVFTHPAHALCPQTGCPGGGTSTVTWTNTLTVATPSSGNVSDGVATGNAALSCPTDCTAVSKQTTGCTDGDCADPDPNGWTSFTLTATNGPSGFSPSWTGCDSVTNGQCNVYLDSDKSVSLAWVDTSAPSVSLGVATNAGEVGPSAAVTATAGDNAGVSRVDWFIGAAHETLRLTDTTAPYGGNIDLSSLADGSSVTIWARSTDINNLQSGFVSQTVTLDKHVSETLGTIAVPAGALSGFTNAATVPLSVSTDADASMACSVSGAATIAPAPCAGTFSPLTASSADGAYTYTVKTTDNVGNTATDSRTFVLDRTPPAINTFDGPAEGGQVSTDSVTFTFSPADANLATVTCSLDGTSKPCTTSATYNLANGTHHFTVVATDKAGNQGTKTRTFAVQKAVVTPTPTPTPGPGPGPGPSPSPTPTTPKPNPARLAYSYSYSLKKHLTRFPVLTVKGLAKGSTIKATCKGTGCPKPLTLKKKSGSIKLVALTKPSFKPGSKITITITCAGFRTKTVKITVRKGAPKVA